MDTKKHVGPALLLAETIRDLKEVPSGHLYASVMNHMCLDTYNAYIGALKGAKLVKEEHHLLTWIGPDLK